MKELLIIAERLRTQDNACTEHPMFCVQEKNIQYGMDPQFCDHEVWIDTSDGVEEVEAPADGEETDTITRSGKFEYWETVMVAFTLVGCQEYLKLNGHNHRGETRIYVESLRRCPEMIAIREYLLSLKAKVPDSPKGEAIQMEQEDEMTIEKVSQAIRRDYTVKSLKGIRPHIGGFIYFIEVNSINPSFIIGKIDDDGLQNPRTLFKCDSELIATEKWEAKTKGLWIPVEDALPTNPYEVLVTDGEGAWLGYYLGGTWYQDHEPSDSVVTHWREIPELPQV